MKIVIVGGSFSGIHCAMKAKELYPEDNVILIEKEKEIGFLPSGLILLLNESVKHLDEAHFITVEQIEKLGIEVLLGTTALSYDFQEKTVETDRGYINYDRLVLASGSSQWSQKLGTDHDSLITYKGKEAAKHSLSVINKSDDVVIVGAGQSGMELASALCHQGKHVKIIDSMSYPMHKYFDEDLLLPFMADIQKREDITFKFRETVRDISGEETLQVVTQTDTYEGDCVVFGVNVRPSLTVFDQKLASHSDQTLKVDAYLETSETNVFAIGDLIQVPYLLMGTSIYLPLINNAVRSGIVCAENLKEKQVVFHGSIRIIGTYLFNHYLASCGMTEADSFLYEGEIGTLLTTLPIATLSNETIRIKLIYDKETERLLGTQLISTGNVLEKINTYAVAIDAGLTLRDLEQRDYFYHPLFTNPVDEMTLLDYKGCRVD